MRRRQEEADDDAEQGREALQYERRLQVDRVGDGAERDGRDPAEAHREARPRGRDAMPTCRGR